MRTGVVLLAAGSGRRFGRARPKQFMTLNREPLFMNSFRVFEKIPSVKEIAVVSRPSDLKTVARWTRRSRKNLTVRMIAGGEFRGASVRNGVKALAANLQVVLVHDTARPLVTREIVRRVEKAAFKTGVALAAWPLNDTLKLASAQGRVRKTVPRKNLWLAQTPQGFRRDIALKCLLHPSPSATDDVELAQRKGYPVQVVEGSATNMKVTYPADLKICQALAK
jgi:2-C-methyl-D-erythritol 4-phosphate cytidylyltransferase